MKELNIEIAVKIYDYEELDAADRELMDAAREATNRSYAPYSHFSVGAAARLANGIVVTGTNQENAAYPSGLCAERTTLFYANSQHPDQAVTTLAIAARNEHDEFLESPIPPCGACPASDARNGEALQAANAGVAVWQKGNLRAEECGRITATLVRCFGHEVTEPIKY